MEFVNIARNEEGLIVGGVSGSAYLLSLEIEVLWVYESYIGQKISSHLLREIEHRAKIAGCQIARLTTYSFQTPLFIKNMDMLFAEKLMVFPMTSDYIL